MRIRKIKKYGNTYVIRLSPNDLEDLGLKVNDYVNIEDITKIKYKKLYSYQTKEDIKDAITNN